MTDKLKALYAALDRLANKEDKASLAHAKALQEAIERESK